jgi:ATP-dependent RNA helicase DeaD
METLDGFETLGLSQNTLNAVAKKGFEEPTPIQAKIIPLLLTGDRDLVGRAQTGTGKTAAFGLPLIDKLAADQSSRKETPVKAIILVPTRELALQVSEEIHSLRGESGIQILPVYGGQAMEPQIKRLRKGVHIVVGTPGRVLDHLHRKTLILDEVTHVVLDEADEMLNMGFIEDVEEILAATPATRRTMLFSATMPDRILHLAKKHMKNFLSVSVEKESLTVSLTDQIYFEVAEADKLEALCRIIDMEDEFYGLVFCHTKIEVDRIAGRLIDRGYEADAIHGDISQPDREKILNQFRKQTINILVATDVAARGIDITDLTHVINYSLPQNAESYIHRIGRTGRAGKKGTAITFITPEEYRKLMYIQRMTRTQIKKKKVPGINDVIKTKRAKIKGTLLSAITGTEESPAAYETLAAELLKDNDPVRVVTTLLKHSFEDELDEAAYNDIREISVDVKGQARLFVGLGRKDHMTPGKLVNFIFKITNVSGHKIQDVQVFDAFSFITVPFKEAEFIIGALNRQSKGPRPLVKHAIDKQGFAGKKGGKPRKFKA